MKQYVAKAKKFVTFLETRTIRDYKGIHGRALYAASLSLHCARELKHDQATMMAAALTYRTIFSLIPMIVLGLLVFKAVGGFESYEPMVRKYVFEQMGLPAIELPSDNPFSENFDPDYKQEVKPATPPMTPAMAQAADADAAAEADKVAEAVALEEGQPATTQPVLTESAKNQLRASLNGILDQLTSQVSKLSFGSIGGVGFLVLVWGALGLIITVEQTFNKIFGCEQGRPWHMRIPLYWAVLTLGPVLLSVSLYLTGKIIGMVETFGTLGPFVKLISIAGAVTATWLMLVLLYTLLPNTRVAIKSAMIGALVAAVLFEFGKFGFQLYVTHALPFFKFYGVLGLFPLFLLWVYITWLIVLFGLELAYTLQAMNSGRFKHFAYRLAQAKYLDPRMLVSIMTRTAIGFNQGSAVTVESLEAHTRLSTDKILDLTERLKQGGLLHQVDGGTPDSLTAYTLSKPPDAIGLNEVFQLAFPVEIFTGESGGLPDGLDDAQEPKPSDEHGKAMTWVNATQQAAIGNTTLADLVLKIAEKPAPTANPTNG